MKQDKDLTKKQLLDKIAQLQGRVADLEAVESEEFAMKKATGIK